MVEINHPFYRRSDESKQLAPRAVDTVSSKAHATLLPSFTTSRTLPPSFGDSLMPCVDPWAHSDSEDDPQGDDEGRDAVTDAEARRRNVRKLVVCASVSTPTFGAASCVILTVLS
jgi:hypothetical protein